MSGKPAEHFLKHFSDFIGAFLQNLLSHNRLCGIYALIRMVLVSCSCLQSQEKYKWKKSVKRLLCASMLEML